MRMPKKPHRPNLSRLGCWTCKKRHRKCDESRPSCKKCTLYGEECEGYGARRLAFRVNTGTVVQKYQGTLSATQKFSRAMLQSSPSIQPSNYELMLLKEFVQIVSNDLGISESYNLWRDDIAPLALGADRRYLLNAICAITVMHRSYLERVITSEALRYYSAVVVELKIALESYKKSMSPPDALLATLFLLTWFEILACDWEKWNVHLAAMCNIILDLCPYGLWDTRFGQRLICAVARLDAPNTIWQLNPLLLDAKVYELLQFENKPYDEANLEEATILAFNRLHVLMASFAEIYSTWLCGSATPSVIQFHMETVLRRLEEWHAELPSALQWVPGAEQKMPPLQSTLLIHYLSTKLFAIHVLNPACSLPDNEANPFCRWLALQICSFINNLGPPQNRRLAHFRGDVGIILPLSIVSMFLKTSIERSWISGWLKEINHEGIWCGLRRSMIVEAWGKCEQAASARPLHTMIGDDNINWKPGKGFNVRILATSTVDTKCFPVQFYIDYQQNLPFAAAEFPLGW